MLRLIIIFFIILFFESSSFSKDVYLTLRNEKVNLRQGPSFEYPIKIFYKKKFLPVLIQEVYGNFKKIKDHENNSGWIHVSQLSKKKAALTYGDKIIMFKNPTIFSTPLAILEKGRLCLISKCKEKWCKIKTDKYLGWVKKESLWGNFN